MKIANFYSHLNGWEHIKVHKPHIWDELEKVVDAVDAEACKTKVSKEKRTQGRIFYSPKDMNKAYKRELHARGWNEKVTRYFVTDDELLILRTMHMTTAEQKAEIIAAGKTPISSYSRTGLIKDKIELRLGFRNGQGAATAQFSRAEFFFQRRVIDVSICVVPVRDFQAAMSNSKMGSEVVLNRSVGRGQNAMTIPMVIVGVAP